MPLISADVLTRFVQDILLAANVPPNKASITAASLVASNLRGVDSHGIQLLPFYVDQMLAGEMDPKADGHVISEMGSCLVFDGENGLGQWVADSCCRHAVRIAAAQGMALVVSRESNHFGAAAWWAQKMRAAGQIGIVMCNASPIVPPWQGKEGRMGTNPICMSVPGPWLLDMATTTVAAGRIFKAFINGQPEVPAGWAFDSDGVPTTDTQKAYKGMLMPLGGYKGSGLAMMVEILCSVLSGGAMANEIGGIRVRGKKVRNSQMFMAIDVARFMPVLEFEARVEQLVALMKSTATAPGFDEVMVAGDPEWRTEADRKANGIPIADGNWDGLVKTGLRVNVAAPASLQ
ncbi:MAG TPA: Ldh family oxidoreductase [Candidatus Sulfopaludibacter sp.]|jgi:LDH2 family malate/lactate/ureidoglycolate dehydrogenase|nr:Ldh family oxidoreductase [Candidatus Sulfopaludibacter sp.]